VATSNPPALTPREREALQRRTLATLSISQVLGSAGLTSGITVGGLIAKDLLGGETWAGLATASLTLGSALGSAQFARLMVQRGRRPGLVAGYLVGMLGGLVAVVAADQRSFPLLVLGSVLLGCGQASNLLARYAAADLAETGQRARAISRLVFMSTFGAVAGPAMVGLGEALGRSVGIEELAGPYLLSVAFFAASTVVTALAGAAPSLLFVGLFLLGLGWSVGLIAGSTMLTNAVDVEHRTRVQGAADLTMSLCGGAAGLASGFVKHSVGFHMLSNAGTLAAGFLLVAALTAVRSAGYRRPTWP
jgi:MFS family permease